MAHFTVHVILGFPDAGVKTVKVSEAIKRVKVSEAISQTSLLKCANKVF